MFSYTLVPGGYEIFQYGIKMICQPHSPSRGIGALLQPNEAENIAKFLVRKLELGCEPYISVAEEAELIGGVTEARIEEMAQECKAQMETQRNQQITREQEIASLKAELQATQEAIDFLMLNQFPM